MTPYNTPRCPYGHGLMKKKKGTLNTYQCEECKIQVTRDWDRF